MDGQFYTAALEEALSTFTKPSIFNSDQGAQFTANAFTDCLRQAGVEISTDGRVLNVKYIGVSRQLDSRMSG